MDSSILPDIEETVNAFKSIYYVFTKPPLMNL